MHLLTMENMSKSYGEKVLFDDITLGIDDNDKIGVIGINGTGKSTLLKILAGIEEPDAGNFIKRNGMRIEYLSQEPPFDPEATIIQQIFKGDTPEMVLMQNYESVLEKVEAGDLSFNDELMALQTKIDENHLWELESAAKTVLTKLKIKDYNRKMGVLSGGQRKRVALASALIAQSDLLILDEPTNHMDSDSIGWLEDYLNKRKSAVVMITHDRYFLDRVTNRIVELDGGQLFGFEGNYSVFVEKKMERDELEINLQKKKRNLYRNELAWIRRGALARSTKQKARIQRFEELKGSLKNTDEEQLELSVFGSRLGKTIIELENVDKAFGEVTCLSDFTYTLLRDDRIGILGRNGVGKSTLMNIIASRIEPDSGNIRIGETVKVGYFSQETYHMDDEQRIIDFVKEIAEYLPLSDGSRISASSMLERFLFNKDLQYSYIGKLSGGEKRRLHLLSVLMESPNVLLLDEPTNDLDIATLRILEDFIDHFVGPVITVSHDRYFLDRVCDKMFVFNGAGHVDMFPGNYSDYIDRAKVEQVPVSQGSKAKVNDKSWKTPPKKKFSYQEKKEFETIDGDIEKLEERISFLDQQMEQHATNYGKVYELTQEKEEVEKALEEKMDRWAYLNELAEEINNQ